MRRASLVLGLFVVLCAAAGSVAAETAQTTGGETGIENFDRYVGRDLVKENRAPSLGIFRPLPLQCPPFHLRDENGDIIDPTKDEFGLDIDPKEYNGTSQAVSTKQTCGACHPYETITKGYHFQTGRDEMFPEPPAGAAHDPSLSPGYFGKWQLLYHRELAPRQYDDPSEIDMTPWEFTLQCSICHPGGGPMEYDRSGQRYTDVLQADRGGATLFGNSDYQDQIWEKSGVLEADCLICHLEGYEYSLRVQQIKKYNFKWAATAGAAFGYVWGSVKDGQEPKVYYDLDLFRADGTVYLHIRHPEDRQCLACHDISSAQKRGQSWHTSYMQDVHTEQGLGCVECHANDIRHNFTKGSSSGQTVREDLDNTALSCKECHEREEHGAPNYTHEWLPALHLERISCEACHITHRPFAQTGTVDTITGEAKMLPIWTNPNHFDTWLFGAQWGKTELYAKSTLLTDFTPGELARAADYTVQPGDAMRRYFSEPDGSSRLPEEAFAVRAFVKDKGIENPDARALMLLALEATVVGEPPEHAVVVYRGTAERFDAGGLLELSAELQPRRAGSTIAETPYYYGRSKNDGMIHPEGYQLGAFWAYAEEDLDGELVARPLFLKDMEAAYAMLHSDEYKFFRYRGQAASGKPSPAMPPMAEMGEETPEMSDQERAQRLMLLAEEEAKVKQAMASKLSAYTAVDREPLEVYDDNNDAHPEANTQGEIALMGWALKQASPRLRDRQLYYIRGAKVFKVDVKSWENPFEKESLAELDRVGENESFIAIQKFEERETEGDYSWEERKLVWAPGEVRLARDMEVEVEEIDREETAVIGGLAERLAWTASHGVEPSERALGVKCQDCHSADSHFYYGPAVIDPFTSDATPESQPMYKHLGYKPEGIQLGIWRETVLKPLSPWIVLGVLLLMLVHYTLVGSKGGKVTGPANVKRFMFHERLFHLVSMTTVVALSLTGFFFLLGRNDPTGHWARPLHTWLGYGSAVGVAGMFLFWVWFAFPRKGDVKWLLLGGGYLGFVKGHLPAGKFNAGQKVLFWLAMLAMGVLIATGFIMGLNRSAHFANQELMYTVHDVAGLVMILVLMGHFYLAAIVVPHSLRAIFGGKVNADWAREHHSEWKFKEPQPEPHAEG